MLNGEYGPQPKPPASEEQPHVGAPLLESLKEKKEPSLGETNPMLHGADLSNSEVFRAITMITEKNIDHYGGARPTEMRTALVADVMGKIHPRIVVQFELDTVSEEQIQSLESIIRQIYTGIAVRTRKGSDGRARGLVNYQHFEQKKKKKSGPEVGGTLLGWHMGPDVGYVDAASTGLYIFRDVGDTSMSRLLNSRSPSTWFTIPELVDPVTKLPIPKNKYLIEIREGGMYQTDLVEFMTLVSLVVAGKELPPHSELFYKIYNDLNKLGLRKTSREQIAGMDEVISNTERATILPLANYGASLGMELRPNSVLYVGVPGTGKTLLAEYFLQQDTGVFFVPLDVLDMLRELSMPHDEQKILPRIGQVFAQTGIPIVIHIDDVEQLAQEGDINKSKLLNLMAGVRERGFYVLASTNHPEKINPQLLQPERFQLEYVGLPVEDARKAILDIHATRVSKELNMPLFASDEERGQIISALAEITSGYTARYLGEICTQAKAFYLQRISHQKGRRSGLREQDLDLPFTKDDWKKAFTMVNAKYDKEATEKRDAELREFVHLHQRQMGFIESPREGSDVTLFDRAFDRLSSNPSS